MSLKMFIAKQVIKHEFKPFYAMKDLDYKEFGTALAKLKQEKKMTSEPSAKIKKAIDIETLKVGDCTCYKARSKTRSIKTKVLYLHGGGFFAEAFPLHWDFCKRLIEKTGCEIIFPAYPLVPESDSENSHNVLLEIYKYVLRDTDPNDLILMGDSAGGTLCLSLSMMARDNDLPLARELILVSPGFAIEGLNEEEKARYKEISEHDFIIGQFPVRKIAYLWLGNLQPTDYRVNVLDGSVKGLPKITLFSGTYDVMNVPTQRFVAKLKEENHPYLFKEKQGGYHVYALFTSSTEEFELIASKVSAE